MRALNLRCFIDEKQARLQHAPKLRPRFERAANFQPIGKHNNRGILKRTEQFTGDALLLLPIRLSLCFVRLLACQLRIGRQLKMNQSQLRRDTKARFSISHLVLSECAFDSRTVFVPHGYTCRLRSQIYYIRLLLGGVKSTTRWCGVLGVKVKRREKSMKGN